MLTYRKLLALTLAALLALPGCGGQPEVHGSLENLGGWWQVTDDWMDRSGLRPICGYFYLDPDTGTAEGYDEYGQSLGPFQCTLEEGSTLFMENDMTFQYLEVDPSGTALYNGDTLFFRWVEEEPEPEPIPFDYADLSGRWYYGSDSSQWLELREDGTFCVQNEAGEILEESEYEINYLLPEPGDILSIHLGVGIYDLIPALGLPAFYLDEGGDGFDCCIHESILGTSDAQRVLNGTRICNLSYASPVEELEYPTHWVLRFIPGSVILEKLEDRGWDGTYIYQEEWTPWSVTADGILTMEFQGNEVSFSLEEIQESIAPDPQWPVFYR